MNKRGRPIHPPLPMKPTKAETLHCGSDHLQTAGYIQMWKGSIMALGIPGFF